MGRIIIIAFSTFLLCAARADAQALASAFRQCESLLNEQALPLHDNLCPSAGVPYGSQIEVPMHFGASNPEDARDFCFAHTWIGGVNEDNEGWYQVRANWLGPDIVQSGGSDWDCEHTSLTMAVYTMRSSQNVLGTWTFRGYVSLAGSSQDGRCIYSDDSVVDELYTEPDSAEPAVMWLGDSLVGFPPTRGDGATYFSFAVAAWSHDTPDLGHQLDLCADPENCYWPFYLEAWLQ